MTAQERLIDALERAGRDPRDHGGYITARCPVPGHGAGNGDIHPSLEIRPRRDGRGVRIECHCGCDYRDVLGELGLRRGDVYDDAEMRRAYRPDADYRYSNGDTKKRHTKLNGDKSMWWEKKGHTGNGALYGADQIPPGRPLAVFLTEAERGADLIRANGAVAVSTGGSGELHRDVTPLRGCDVTGVVDRDNPGLKWAKNYRERLAGVAASVRWARAAVDLPAADVAEHLDHDLTLDQLEEFDPATTTYDDDEPEPEPVAGNGSPEEESAEPTTWEPLELGPWLDGSARQPQPSLGLARSDGLHLIYPGREHAILGETESGKTWFALGCVVPELIADHDVVYIHYEEGDPLSTIERLQLIGVRSEAILDRLYFCAPDRAPHIQWVAALVELGATLVVHDGVNAAMSLLGLDVNAVDGAAEFRRRLVSPFTRTGAAVLTCDHMPRIHDAGRRDAYGSVHKGNALDGARILLENTDPFGRGMRGASYVFVTKDRPGYLRTRGRASKTPGKTFVGIFVVDDSKTFEPFEFAFYAPRDDDKPADSRPELADTIHELIAALPDRTAPSLRMLFAQLRQAGHQIRTETIRDAVDDLLVARRLIEVPGPRGARGYEAVATASLGISP